jgi:hypothetical protein
MWANLTLIKLFVKFPFKNKLLPNFFYQSFLQLLKILCFSLCFFLPHLMSHVTCSLRNQAIV